MEGNPLSSKESIEKRREVHFIVAAYLKRHPEVCQALHKAGIHEGTTHLDLTDTLLNGNVIGDEFEDIAHSAREYLNTLDESARISALDNATL